MAGLALGPNLLTEQKHQGAHAERELHQPGRSRLCREGSQARGYGVFTSKNQPRVMRHKVPEAGGRWPDPETSTVRKCRHSQEALGNFVTT